MDINELGQSLSDKVLSLADKLLDRIPEEKRRLFLLVLGGLVLLAICLTIMALATGRKIPVKSQATSGVSGIPAEELFYPSEPDFLPPLLLEREPHQPWTVSDLEVFWQDPKAGNEDKWREVIKTMVDKLMDGIP